MNGRFKKSVSDAEFLHLVFGLYSAFRPDRAAVLMFHLERTVCQDVPSHQPTEPEVVHGLYDQESQRWIRGSAGVSLATWRQINRELEDEGLLQVSKKNGESPEYTPQLAALRIAIQEWRERPSPKGREGTA